MSRQRTFGVMFAVLLVAAGVITCLRGSRGPSYAGKSVSYWCDHLPFTDTLPAVLGGGFARLQLTSTDPAVHARLQDTQKQALKAIDAMGTNCLPELVSRLRKKRSAFQFESRKLAAKIGLIHRSEVGIWHMRRMQALTGIIELKDRATDIKPELTALKGDADPWLSAASAHALKGIEVKRKTN